MPPVTRQAARGRSRHGTSTDLRVFRTPLAAIRVSRRKAVSNASINRDRSRASKNAEAEAIQPGRDAIACASADSCHSSKDAKTGPFQPGTEAAACGSADFTHFNKDTEADALQLVTDTMVCRSSDPFQRTQNAEGPKGAFQSGTASKKPRRKKTFCAPKKCRKNLSDLWSNKQIPPDEAWDPDFKRMVKNSHDRGENWLVQFHDKRNNMILENNFIHLGQLCPLFRLTYKEYGRFKPGDVLRSWWNVAFLLLESMKATKLLEGWELLSRTMLYQNSMITILCISKDVASFTKSGPERQLDTDADWFDEDQLDKLVNSYKDGAVPCRSSCLPDTDKGRKERDAAVDGPTLCTNPSRKPSKKQLADGQQTTEHHQKLLASLNIRPKTPSIGNKKVDGTIPGCFLPNGGVSTAPKQWDGSTTGSSPIRSSLKEAVGQDVEPPEIQPSVYLTRCSIPRGYGQDQQFRVCLRKRKCITSTVVHAEEEDSVGINRRTAVNRLPSASGIITGTSPSSLPVDLEIDLCDTGISPLPPALVTDSEISNSLTIGAIQKRTLVPVISSTAYSRIIPGTGTKLSLPAGDACSDAFGNSLPANSATSLQTYADSSRLATRNNSDDAGDSLPVSPGTSSPVLIGRSSSVNEIECDASSNSSPPDPFINSFAPNTSSALVKGVCSTYLAISSPAASGVIPETPASSSTPVDEPNSSTSENVKSKSILDVNPITSAAFFTPETGTAVSHQGKNPKSASSNSTELPHCKDKRLKAIDSYVDRRHSDSPPYWEEDRKLVKPGVVGFSVPSPVQRIFPSRSPDPTDSSDDPTELPNLRAELSDGSFPEVAQKKSDDDPYAFGEKEDRPQKLCMLDCQDEYDVMKFAPTLKRAELAAQIKAVNAKIAALRTISNDLRGLMRDKYPKKRGAKLDVPEIPWSFYASNIPKRELPLYESLPGVGQREYGTPNILIETAAFDELLEITVCIRDYIHKSMWRLVKKEDFVEVLDNRKKGVGFWKFFQKHMSDLCAHFAYVAEIQQKKHAGTDKGLSWDGSVPNEAEIKKWLSKEWDNYVSQLKYPVQTQKRVKDSPVPRRKPKKQKISEAD